MCGAPARDNDFDPPNLHTVVLDDLVSAAAWPTVADVYRL